jgi:hypothetical protein
MAKQTTSTGTRIATPKKKRAGVHAKKKNSTSKKSKNYQKKYSGQGR